MATTRTDSIARPPIVGQILSDFDYPEEGKNTGLTDARFAHWRDEIQTTYPTNGALCGWLISCSEHMRGGGLLRAAQQLMQLAEAIVQNIDFETATKKRTPATPDKLTQSLGHQVKSSGVGLRAKR